MWMMTTFGFFSIVEKPSDRAAGTLTVRARARADLDHLRAEILPGLGPTVDHAGTDYPYRAVAPRGEVAVALAAGALSAWSQGTGRLRLVLFGQHTMSLDVSDAAALGRAMDALAALNAGPVAAQGDDARFELRTLSRAVRSVAIVALHDAPLAGPQAAAALGSRLAVAWLVARASERVTATPGARVVDASRLARALGVPT